VGNKIQILIDRDLHRKVKAAAAIRGESITDFADEALAKRLRELDTPYIVQLEAGQPTGNSHE
jgi:uncharacterized protein (DUF1778 family)